MSTRVTRAPGGPRCAHCTRRSTASGGPSATNSTRPSGKLRTQPLTPRRNASSCMVARKKTPWTYPLMKPWTRFRAPVLIWLPRGNFT